MRAFWYFSIGVFWAVAACGQAIVEHSVATAGSSAATAGVSGTGKSIGGVFRSLNETLDKAGGPGTAEGNGSTPAPKAVTTGYERSRPSAKPVPASKPVPSKPVPISKPIDPSQVTVGLDRAELIQRFGEPVLSFSETRNSQLVERLWYNTTTPDQLEIRLIGDKVASVRPPASTIPATQKP
jgi:hypothetical protein